MPPRSRATPAPAEPAHVEQSQLAESVDRLTREIQAMRDELDEARAEIAWAMRNAIAERPGELLDTTATESSGRSMPLQSTPNPSPGRRGEQERTKTGVTLKPVPAPPLSEPRSKPPPGQLF